MKYPVLFLLLCGCGGLMTTTDDAGSPTPATDAGSAPTFSDSSSAVDGAQPSCVSDAQCCSNGAGCTFDGTNQKDASFVCKDTSSCNISISDSSDSVTCEDSATCTISSQSACYMDGNPPDPFPPPQVPQHIACSGDAKCVVAAQSSSTTVVCSGQSTCNVDCTSGKCTVLCLDAASCTVSCISGNCLFDCATTGTCKTSCTYGTCDSCQDQPSLCACTSDADCSDDPDLPSTRKCTDGICRGACF